MLPLLSYALQRGRCRHCGVRLSLFYPAIELAALGVVLWAMTETTGATLLLTCLLGWMLLPLALIDWRHFLLPDALTLPLLGLGLIGTGLLDPESLPNHALGAAIGYTVFAGISLGYRRLRGREGLGWGDVKLLAAIGAWLGWAGLPGVVLLASGLGLLEALFRRVRGAGAAERPEERIALGTWLCAALWLGWLYGPLLAR
jgi:leader peptidase (prepilin peptidase) / N-methyltransferase